MPPATSKGEKQRPLRRTGWSFWPALASLALAAAIVAAAAAGLYGQQALPAVVIAPAWALLSGNAFRAAPAPLRQRARELLAQHLLVDGHNDLAIYILAHFRNHIYAPDFRAGFERGGLGGQTDLARIDAGLYSGAFWSAFVLCQPDIFDFADAAYHPVVQATLGQLDLLHRLRLSYPSYFPSTPDARSALRHFRGSAGRARQIAAPLSIEGLHQIGNSASNLRMFYDLGVRAATLTWNCHNVYADAAVLTFVQNGTSRKADPLWGGLSHRGRDIVREMNRLGMIVDLAHVSPDTMRDVLVGEHGRTRRRDDDAPPAAGGHSWQGSLAPVVFSHSSSFALCPHPRNVPDDVLPLVKARRSLVMVNFSPDFISCKLPIDQDTGLPTPDPAEATIAQVVRHMRHIGDLIGFDHVGIGSDFNGIETTPVGLEGVDKMPDLVEEMLRQGIGESDVVKILGRNLLRVWKEVEETSAKLNREGDRPLEDASRIYPAWLADEFAA